MRVSLISAEGGATLSETGLRRRLKRFMMIGILGLALVGSIYGGLIYWRSVVESRSQEIEKTVQAIDARIAERQKALAPIQDFQALAKAADKVLRNHTHWTQVLKLLEERALPEVQFGSLAGAETGTLSFDVRARDYTTLAKQIVALREDPRVRKVSVAAASADFDENGLLKGARAAVTMGVDPTIFDFK